MREAFEATKLLNIQRQGNDEELRTLALDFMRETGKYKYTYNFTWLGIPCIQFPQDLFAIQELIFSTQPNLIVETGVAHGGGVVFYASMLEMLGNDGQVVGVDIALRDENRKAIMAHAMSRRITLLEGSSTDPRVFARVAALAVDRPRVLVILDSDHTHAHVLRELQLYSQLVPRGSYIVVLDTTIEDQPAGFFRGRAWDKTNNPKTAVREFLKSNRRFVVDRGIEDKLLITTAREGYLQCVGDTGARGD